MIGRLELDRPPTGVVRSHSSRTSLLFVSSLCSHVGQERRTETVAFKLEVTTGEEYNTLLWVCPARAARAVPVGACARPRIAAVLTWTIFLLPLSVAVECVDDSQTGFCRADRGLDGTLKLYFSSVT